MKRILFIALFVGLLFPVCAQLAPPKAFYAPDGNYIAVAPSIQDGKSPAVDNAEVLIVSGKIKLKGNVKRYEVDSPFCFFEFGDVEFKDSICIKVIHPDFETYENNVPAKNFLGKYVVLLKRTVVK